MIQVYIVFFKIFVFLALGFVLNKTKVIGSSGERALSDILLKAVLPFMILSSSQHDYSSDAMNGMITCAAVTAGYYAITLIAMRLSLRKMKILEDEKRIMVTCTVFANTGFVGFPLMEALFGSYGLLLAAVYNLCYNVFFYTYAVYLFSRKPKFALLDMFKSSVSLASILAIVLFIIPWRMPDFVAETFKMIGDMTVPMSMIVMGSMLAGVNVRKLLTDKKAYVVSALRLMVIPAVVMGVLLVLSRWITMLPETMSVIVLMCALPCGSMNVIFAENYEVAPHFSARTVSLSMIFMLVTLMFWAWAVKAVF
ncbi:MAG: AEC family transporter [Clostridiales bacterium]|nr:AEC family transporter [Clostridiales bacterium]